MNTLTRVYPVILATTVWLTLAIQLALYVISAPVTTGNLAWAVLKFFTFFTVLTNILAALTVTAFALPHVPGHRHFFARPTTATAVASYTIIVGIVYTLIIQEYWHPTGLQLCVDTLLHHIIPIAYLVFWIIYIPKGQLRWRSAILWLAFPLGFALINITAYAFVGHNPYPFLDLNALGCALVMRNVALLTLAFLATALLFIAADKLMSRRPRWSTST